EPRLQDRPVAVPGRDAELTLEMALEIVLDAIVVQQRVVHVDEEDDGSGHEPAPTLASTRPEARVSSCSDCSAAGASVAAVTRQRQFPCALPGWFMRASLPRLSTSCSGAIASAATDDHASPSKPGAASSTVPVVRRA